MRSIHFVLERPLVNIELRHNNICHSQFDKLRTEENRICSRTRRKSSSSDSVDCMHTETECQVQFGITVSGRVMSVKIIILIKTTILILSSVIFSPRDTYAYVESLYKLWGY